MKEQFIPYELALKLKEIGFNEECWFKYDVEGNLKQAFVFHHNRLSDSCQCTAPLWQQAFDWFRVEKYKYSDIYRTGTLFSANIECVLMGNSLCGVVKEVTYEEARLECLKKLIEIVENEKRKENS